MFGVSSSGVVMQTGSTAGVITLSAALTLGQYVVTGSSPVTQDISIPAAAPQILSFQIGSMDTAGFNLLLTGLSDTRSLNQLAFTFTPTQGSSLATTTLTADVSAAFNSWYQSAASDSFGGQFTPYPCASTSPELYRAFRASRQLPPTGMEPRLRSRWLFNPPARNNGGSVEGDFKGW